jgi:hypothetical protein
MVLFTTKVASSAGRGQAEGQTEPIDHAQDKQQGDGDYSWKDLAGERCKMVGQEVAPRVKD